MKTFLRLSHLYTCMIDTCKHSNEKFLGDWSQVKELSEIKSPLQMHDRYLQTQQCNGIFSRSLSMGVESKHFAVVLCRQILFFPTTR